tara:strand:- start:735 stop:1205 length:471 start_codon:yes stop_codon:yes gene_type:complete
MIKTIIKAIYAAFISMVLVSFVLACWTSYAFIFQTSKSNEISNVLKHMYSNQKSVVIDIIDLSKILLQDSNLNISSEKSNLEETELLIDHEANSQIDESLITNDNIDNPLGIIIERSIAEESSKTESETGDDVLLNENDDLLMSDLDLKSEMINNS